MRTIGEYQEIIFKEIEIYWQLIYLKVSFLIQLNPL